MSRAYKPRTNKRFKTLGEMGVCSVGEIQIGWKKSHPEMASKVEPCIVSCSTDLKDYFQKVMSQHIGVYECMYALYLNRANGVIGWNLLGQGAVAGTTANIPGMVQVAVLLNASSVILLHNHPSGNAKPSAADNALTKKVKEALAQLDIRILDHLILTPSESNYYSYADEGML
jgi:DNA repair protein RadC